MRKTSLWHSSNQLPIRKILFLAGFLDWAALAAAQTMAGQFEEIAPDEPETGTPEVLPVGDGAVEIDQITIHDGDDELISISVADARIQDVLRSLAAMRPKTTIMIDEAISGQVSFELHEVPWQLALELVAETQDLRIEQRSENIFLIQPSGSPTREQDTRDLIIELHSRESIGRLAPDQLLELYKSDQPIELIREAVMAQPEQFIKRLTVSNQKAIDAIDFLARNTMVDFAFSTHFTPAPGDTDESEQVGVDGGTPVSINLRNRSVAEAIRLIARLGGLSATLQDGIWEVKPIRPEQRYLEPLITRTFQVRYIQVDEQLMNDLNRLSSERGKIIARGKTITVFDTVERIEQIERIITDQDLPTPQVLIEARFFVLAETTSQELGINWTGLDDGLSFSAFPDPLRYNYRTGRLLGPVDANTGDFISPVFLENSGRLGDSLDPSYFPPSPRPALPDGITAIDPRTATLTLPELRAVLHALEGMDKARQLSNPKIIVASDEQATIHIGRQEPIIKSSIDTSGDRPITTYELDTNFGGETIQVPNLITGRSGQPDASTSYSGYTGYLDLGTKLTVAPSVKTEEEVYIRIVPELINRPGQITLNQQTFPILFRVRVQTQFNLFSGQTIAIGGLVSEDTEEERKAIPILGGLPILGRLFRYDKERLVRSETIIFLTVRVLNAKSLDTASAVPVNARDVRSEIERIRQQDSDAAVEHEEMQRRKMARPEKPEEAEDSQPEKPAPVDDSEVPVEDGGSTREE